MSKLFHLLPSIDTISHRCMSYVLLTRIDRPIGVFLLLWPTLWALWIASSGIPDIEIASIFILGTLLMRSAGCAFNDYADREVDGKVRRTQGRPLAQGVIRPTEAIWVAVILSFIAFLLVLQTNKLTILLSFAAILLAGFYPFMKRFTSLPQVFLGAAFAWGIPMAYAAVQGQIPEIAWLIYFATLLWVVAYDTEYAMIDRADDINVGVRSTAILFGDQDRIMIGILQVLTFVPLSLIGLRLGLSFPYWVGLGIAAVCFTYQQWLIKDRLPQGCWRAFLNNSWVGASIFGGILFSYL